MIIDLNGWTSPIDTPTTDRIVLIVTKCSLGEGLKRGMGFYKEGHWKDICSGEYPHKVLAWEEYPELPVVSLQDTPEEALVNA